MPDSWFIVPYRYGFVLDCSWIAVLRRRSAAAAVLALLLAGAIWVTLVRAMLELPTFKIALPLEIEAELTVPVTCLPLLSVR